MRASENARLRKSVVDPVGVECAMRVDSLWVRAFAPPNEQLLPHSALFNSAGSRNSKPTTRFRSVFCCSGKTSGSASVREEEGKLSFFLQTSGNWCAGTFPIMENEQRGL